MKRYFILINLLLLMILAYAGVDIFYRSLTARLFMLPEMEAGQTLAKEETNPGTKPVSHYDPIVTRNLFNTKKPPEKKPEPEPVPVVEKKEKPPEETRLNLKLVATISGSQQLAAAVIEDKKTRQQKLYYPGYPIPHMDAVVKEVLWEKVILTVNGKDEFLAMEDNEGSAGPRQPVPPPQQPPPGMHGRIQPGDPDDGVRLSRKRIDNAMQNINSLMRQARIRPHFTDGKPDGLTLTRIKPSSIFSQLGLQNGDVIVGVDGNDIQSVDDALTFYRNLKTGENVSLQIRRKGQIQNIDYTIEE